MIRRKRIEHSASLRFVRIAMVSAVAIGSSPVVAADGAQGLEIIVTAQRRQERVIDIPAAVTAVDGESIARARLGDLKDLITFTPGFSGNSDDSYIDSVAVRGISSNDYGVGGDPSIGIFKDGVYQGRSGAAVTSLYDIERAEALRGPQGFLFGRNAISGALSLVTSKPKLAEFSGHIYAGVGESRNRELEAAVNLPASGVVAFRFAIHVRDYQGWIDNAATTGLDDRLMGGTKVAGRASVRYQQDGLDVSLIAEHEHRRLDGTPYRASNDDREVLDYFDAALGQALIVRGGRHDVDSDLFNPRDDGDITSLTALVEVPLDLGTFSSISAYRHSRFHYLEDYDGTSLFLGNYDQRQRSDYASQEVRIVSPSDQRLTWSAGLSGYFEDVRARFVNEASEELVCVIGFGYPDCRALAQDLYGTSYAPAAGGVLVEINDARSRNSGLSAFADLNLKFRGGFELGAGLRYGWDHKRFGLNVRPSASALGNIWTFTYFTDGEIAASRSWRGLTPRLFAKYRTSDSFSIYASVTRGYKAGGFGSFSVSSPSPVEDFSLVPAGTIPDAFDPETVWSKEVGFKGFAFDRKLQFDLTGFHYIYRNLQTNFFNPESRVVEVVNVGRVIGWGVEGAWVFRPSRYFDVMGNITWTRTRKTGDRECRLRDCGGLTNPTWASSGVATARLPQKDGEAYFQAEWIYLGHRRESFDWRGITRAYGFTTVNVRLGLLSDAGWEIVGYVENLFDITGYQGAENGGGVTPANHWGVLQPRTAGVTLKYRF